MQYLSAVCYCNQGVKELNRKLDKYPESPVDLIKELLNLSDVDLYYLKWEIKDYPEEKIKISLKKTSIST